MTIYTESKKITVYSFDLETGIYTGSADFMTEKGLGLPSGLTELKPSEIRGKVAIMDFQSNEWKYVTDDRGRIFYDKFSGEAVKTTILGEVVDRRRYAKIDPPAIAENQLLRFDDSTQKWVVGFDWYELPIWDNQQNMTYYTGEFFIPDSSYTNVEPMPHEAGFILDDSGKWVEPPEPEAIEE